MTGGNWVTLVAALVAALAVLANAVLALWPVCRVLRAARLGTALAAHWPETAG